MSYDATKGGTAFTGPVTTTTTGRRVGGGAVTTTVALTYRVTFEGAPNGLSAVGGTVVAQPAAPGVTWATITATDTLGRAASDRFAVVAFAPGLAAPALPAVPFAYTDAANPLPAHFLAGPGGASVASTDNTPADNPTTDAAGRTPGHAGAGRPDAPARNGDRHDPGDRVPPGHADRGTGHGGDLDQHLDDARHSASFASASAGATPIFTSGSQRLTMPSTPGTYGYQCAVHGAAMRGTVVVQ